MIVSHKQRFIFVKTVKTAGTSTEIALSKYCGPDDIITPITPEDENLRTALGYPGPQNYLEERDMRALRNCVGGLDLRTLKRLIRARLTGERRKVRPMLYWNHIQGTQIRQRLGTEVWDSYFKFCFERNPWDKVVSYYFFDIRDSPSPPAIREYVQDGRANQIPGFDLYTDRSELIVDEVFRYEELETAMGRIAERLSLPETPVLPNAKGEFRKDRRSYREILSDSERSKIARVYAREIAYFGYEW